MLFKEHTPIKIFKPRPVDTLYHKNVNSSSKKHIFEPNQAVWTIGFQDCLVPRIVGSSSTPKEIGSNKQRKSTCRNRCDNGLLHWTFEQVLDAAAKDSRYFVKCSSLSLIYIISSLFVHLNVTDVDARQLR